MAKDGKFFSWRQAILQTEQLTAMQKLIALVISTYMNDHGKGAYPTQQTIASNASVDVKTVKRATKDLENLGWVKRSPHGFSGQQWRSYDYTISFPERGDTESPASEDTQNQKGGDTESLPFNGEQIQERGGTESPASKKVGTLSPEGGDTESIRWGHTVQNVGAQSPTISPSNSPSNSPVEEERATASVNPYRTWEPDQQTLDLIRARGWRLDPTWLAEFRIHAEDKRIPPNELRKSFVNWLKYERVNDQNLKGRAQRNQSQPETHVRPKREAEFQLDKPTPMKELLGGITS